MCFFSRLFEQLFPGALCGDPAAWLGPELQEHLYVTRAAYRLDVARNPFLDQPSDLCGLDDCALDAVDLAAYSLLEPPPWPTQVDPDWLSLQHLVRSPDRALILGPWVLLSLAQVLDFARRQQQQGLSWSDLAYCYVGMGHFLVLRWNHLTGGLFLQPDGGSSSIERVTQWQRNVEQAGHPGLVLSFREFLYLAHRTCSQEAPAEAPQHLLGHTAHQLWTRCCTLQSQA